MLGSVAAVAVILYARW